MRTRSLVLVMASLPLIITGCASHTVDINGEDQNVNLPEGELVISLGSRIEKGPNKIDNTLSVGYSRGVGQFEQHLDSSERVDLRNRQISGPATLDNEAEIGVGYLRFVRHMFVGEQFEWFWGAGLGHSSLKLTTTDGTTTIGDTNNVTGLHGMAGLAYYFMPMFGFEGTLGGYYFPSDDTSSLMDIKAQLVFTPVDAIRFYAGYRHWGYEFEPSQSGSNVVIDFYGPTAGVTLHF